MGSTVKGKLYRNEEGWLCKVESGRSKYGNVLVTWLSGPVEGRQGRISVKGLTPVCSEQAS